MTFKIYTTITSSLTLAMFIISVSNLSLLVNEGLSYACINNCCIFTTAFLHIMDKRLKDLCVAAQ